MREIHVIFGNSRIFPGKRFPFPQFFRKSPKTLGEPLQKQFFERVPGSSNIPGIEAIDDAENQVVMVYLRTAGNQKQAGDTAKCVSGDWHIELPISEKSDTCLSCSISKAYPRVLVTQAHCRTSVVHNQTGDTAKSITNIVALIFGIPGISHSSDWSPTARPTTARPLAANPTRASIRVANSAPYHISAFYRAAGMSIVVHACFLRHRR